jgi:hypothetical protein
MADFGETVGTIAPSWKEIFRFFLAKTYQKLFIIINSNRPQKVVLGYYHPSKNLDPPLAQRKPGILQFYFIE